jgi:hypothetical protein
MDLVDVPEWKLRAASGGRVLHRATCQTLTTLGDEYQMICGARDELDQDLADEKVSACPVCL